MEQAKVLVLVVDDDQLNRELIETVMRKKGGYRVISASNGESALEKARADHPALMVVDVRLGGGIDGYDVCRAIKEDQGLFDVRIVLQSANDTPQEHQNALACGADAFVAKTSGWKQLLSVITDLLKQG